MCDMKECNSNKIYSRDLGVELCYNHKDSLNRYYMLGESMRCIIQDLRSEGYLKS